MKANELRIGNYVKYATQDTLVLDILRTHAELGYFTDSIGFERKYDEFQPIPLTKEWYYKIDKQLCNLGLEYSHSEITNILFIYLGIMTVECKYVHHIQNLYFALTNNELTNKLQL